MKTKLLLVLTLILLTACSETPTQAPEKTNLSKTIVDTQLNALKAATKNVEAITVQIKKTEKVATEVSLPSGANLYSQKCSSCHGKDAKKSALNASQAIAGWESSKTQQALNGYKNGSYGKKMKNIMQGQIVPLSDNDIKLISDYISIL